MSGCCCTRSLSLGLFSMVKFSEGCINWTVFLKSMILIKKLVLRWWKEVKVTAYFLFCAVSFPLCSFCPLKLPELQKEQGYSLLICQSNTIWLLSSLHFSRFAPVPLDFFMLVVSFLALSISLATEPVCRGEMGWCAATSRWSKWPQNSRPRPWIRTGGYK